ncbi:hypothetical protein C8R47DRAFT_1084738 [Mycena vitilis]|nr:hypothetical protein C8R47DRAFT_1084738 [Mycena vitilis]
MRVVKLRGMKKKICTSEGRLDPESNGSPQSESCKLTPCDAVFHRKRVIELSQEIIRITKNPTLPQAGGFADLIEQRRGRRSKIIGGFSLNKQKPFPGAQGSIPSRTGSLHNSQATLYVVQTYRYRAFSTLICPGLRSLTSTLNAQPDSKGGIPAAIPREICADQCGPTATQPFSTAIFHRKRVIELSQQIIRITKNPTLPQTGGFEDMIEQRRGRRSKITGGFSLNKQKPFPGAQGSIPSRTGSVHNSQAT